VTGTTPTYAVIPTEGRPCLHDCVAALADQVDLTVLVCTNGYDGLNTATPVAQVHDTDLVPNISRWWNIGLESVALLAQNKWLDRWNVLVVNDDTVMAPGSVATLTAGLRKYDGAQLAFPGLRSAEGLMRHPNPIRITGWCFALRGEAGLRADEELAWWAGDNDLDWRARQSGGTVVVPGVDHQHLHPNGYTVARPDLTEQAGKDMARFVEKWGRPAW
jgi:hypothetical protein